MAKRKKYDKLKQWSTKHYVYKKKTKKQQKQKNQKKNKQINIQTNKTRKRVMS